MAHSDFKDWNFELYSSFRVQCLPYGTQRIGRDSPEQTHIKLKDTIAGVRAEGSED